LQVYAPLSKPETFHRSLFVFCCKNGECHKEGFQGRVLRCQLSKENDYYKFNKGTWTHNKETPQTNQCEICGRASTKHCAKCKVVHYCTKDHQVEHWKVGHSSACGVPSTSTNYKQTSSTFSEFELVTEEEKVEKEEEPDEEEEEKLANKEKKQIVEKYKDISNEELDEQYFDMKKDKAFIAFQKAISSYPDQCIRYYGSEGNISSPIWVSEQGQPKKMEIPLCENCGAGRVAEFQILPQLLYKLKIDHENITNAVDWGILTIYTCRANCSHKDIKSGGYLPEWIHKQDFNKE